MRTFCIVLLQQVCKIFYAAVDVCYLSANFVTIMLLQHYNGLYQILFQLSIVIWNVKQGKLLPVKKDASGNFLRKQKNFCHNGNQVHS